MHDPFVGAGGPFHSSTEVDDFTFPHSAELRETSRGERCAQGKLTRREAVLRSVLGSSDLVIIDRAVAFATAVHVASERNGRIAGRTAQPLIPPGTG